MNRVKIFSVFLIIVFFLITGSIFAARYMENLNRGVVAVRTSTSQVYIGWRMFGTDPADIAFNVYRGTTKINSTPVTTSTNITDNTATNSSYTVRPVIGGVEQASSESATVWAQQYLSIPLVPPAGGTTPDGVAYTYSANDCSVGDVDGDGEYEIIMKWDPSNSKDNSQSGYTGDVYLDAYKLNGTRLWRIDLGKNIRAGAHYTQFMVYDLDSDGKAELVCKTAPGTIDGTGAFLSSGPAATDDDSADYRNSSGYILSGPEYLTVFNGQTGKEMYTTNYWPGRGTVSAWGDSYGNRVDRFLACVAYLDGIHPSVVMCRGYYTRTTLAAWDWDGKTLKQRWTFDSDTAGSPYAAHVDGLGNHNLSVGDVNGDGKDEIIYGPIAIDSNGKAMYDTMLGHGDAMHLGKLDPDLPGLQVWDIHENYPLTNGGGELHDAATGAIIWGVPNTGDTGRGMAADIDAGHRGYEMWSPMTGGVRAMDGTLISTTTPSANFRIYWDGDLQDELLDGTKLDKWTGNGTSRLMSVYNYGGATENNGTKANPGLTADILGDWREEMVYRNADSTALLIFTTTIPTTYRFYTLMHDFMYRLSVAWQNVAYNQPPHVGFYLGDGPSAQPKEDIIYPGAANPTGTPTLTATKTSTLLPAATNTLVPSTPTFTATKTSTLLPSATNTIVPSTPTFTATKTNTALLTATNTTVPPAFTNTYTGIPTLTSTTIPPTFTVANTALPTSTNTAFPLSTGTFTPVLTTTNTVVSPTFTSTGTSVLINTNTITFTSTNTAVPPTLTSSATSSVTKTAILTATKTYTAVPPSQTYTATTTYTILPTATYTATTDTSMSAIRIMFKAGDTNNSTNSPHPDIQVINIGTTAIDLNTYEIRYWYNCDCTGQAEQAFVDWAGKQPPGQTVTQEVLISVVSTTKADQTNYVSIKFSGDITLKQDEYVEIQGRFNKSDWSTMLQSNDWSYTQASSFIDWTRITGYQNGALIYGQEPTATQAQLSIANVTSYPNPANPNTGATLSFNIVNPGVSASAAGRTAYITDSDAKVTLKIYTASDRLVWQKELRGIANTCSGGHICRWNGRAAGGQKMASGMYTLRAELKTKDGSSRGYSRIIMLQ